MVDLFFVADTKCFVSVTYLAASNTKVPLGGRGASLFYLRQMDKERLFQQLSSIRKFSQAGKRAPHKPLLLLYALGQWQHGVKQINWTEHEERMQHLLEPFANGKSSMEHPFLRLTSDAKGQLWELTNYDYRTGDGYTAKKLREADATAQLGKEVVDFLSSDPMALHELAAFILDQEFPSSLHEDILSACGIAYQMVPSTAQERERRRDPAFREKVLTAYNRRCAVCGFDLRLGDQLIGLEAAHIRWHNQGGPDITTNGIALCVLHHKLLDFGMLGFTDEAQLLVSRKANGTAAFEDQVLRYEGQQIQLPRFAEDQPAAEYFAWQRKEVFRG